jgi:glyoxylase-like metal-dependent hydrolase (beta-lactamase superfamily II)
MSVGEPVKPVKIVTPPLAANVYLILDEKKAIVDTGGDAAFLIKALGKYINPTEIDYIILTHSHFDHAAAAGELKEYLKAQVIMHPVEYDFVKSFNFSSPLFGINFRPFTVDISVVEGDVIDLGELKLKVFHTPGHTPGSICLYEEDKKWLFSGDVVFPHGSFGRVDFPGGNGAELLKSIERLAKLDVERLYPGHDEPVGRASEHIKRSLMFAKMML